MSYQEFNRWIIREKKKIKILEKYTTITTNISQKYKGYS